TLIFYIVTSIVFFPLLYDFYANKEIRVLFDLFCYIQDDRRTKEPFCRDRRNIVALATRYPVHGSVDVGTDVFSSVNILVLPEWSRFVVLADCFGTEINEVEEWIWQLQCGGFG